MRVLTLWNCKGGTSKTTLATHLAAAFASRGLRTLLVDADPQGHSTQTFHVFPRPEQTTGVLTSLEPPSKLPIAPLDEGAGRLSILPAAPSMYEAGTWHSGHATALPPDEAARRLLALLGRSFDWVIVDSPPGYLDSYWPHFALSAAQKVLVPASAQSVFSLQSVILAVDRMSDDAKRAAPDITASLLGVVATYVDRRTLLGRDFHKYLRSSVAEDLVLQTVIPYQASIANAQALGCTVFVHDPHSRASNAFSDLKEEVITRWRQSEEVSKRHSKARQVRRNGAY